MNPTILNRDFQHPADGWYQIEAPGEHPNKPAGVVQVIDDTAVTSIVNRFNAEADKPGFPGMLIDHEHFKHDQKEETRAYGWLMRLQNRNGVPFGQIRWSGTGKKAVDEGDYRFFSTEYDPADLQILNDKKPRRIRPMRLDGLTLTNVPNNKGMAPITNREEKSPTGAPAESAAVNPHPIIMNTVLKKLGLPANAAEPAVLAEVTRILNRNTELETAVIESDLEIYSDRIPAGQEEFIRQALVTNREQTVAYLEALPPIKSTRPVAPLRVHNRDQADDPSQAPELQTQAAEDETLRRERNEAISDYKVKNRCTHEVATNAVRNRKPELFGIASRNAA